MKEGWACNGGRLRQEYRTGTGTGTGTGGTLSASSGLPASDAAGRSLPPRVEASRSFGLRMLYAAHAMPTLSKPLDAASLRLYVQCIRARGGGGCASRSARVEPAPLDQKDTVTAAPSPAPAMDEPSTTVAASVVAEKAPSAAPARATDEEIVELRRLTPEQEAANAKAAAHITEVAAKADAAPEAEKEPATDQGYLLWDASRGFDSAGMA